MACESESTLSTITVDKRETSLKSVNMEKLALQRSLELLSGKEVISMLVTDAHIQIAAYLSMLAHTCRSWGINSGDSLFILDF